MLAEKRPDIKIVGDELHPLQKVQDFSPYVAKIKASGADTVITGNWSNDMVLLHQGRQGRRAQGDLVHVLRRRPRRADRDRQGRRRHAESGRDRMAHTMRCPSSIRTPRRSRSASPARKTSSPTTGSKTACR